MSAEREVYDADADRYEHLVGREDHQGNILPAVERIRPLAGLDVVELGAGTGRLTRLIAPHARSVRAFDASAHMLATAGASLRRLGLTNWQTAVADHRRVPLPDSSADLVLSGWSFCYLAVWAEGGPDGPAWRPALEAGLQEMKRILRPGGTAILLETLGTGHASPHPPAHLANYYAWLNERGFDSTWIRTDYRFESLQEAGELSAFFFGAEMGAIVLQEQLVVLPECTGLWWRDR